MRWWWDAIGWGVEKNWIQAGSGLPGVIPTVTLPCRRDWAVRFDPGLGTGLCQGNNKTVSQDSLGMEVLAQGWLWPGPVTAVFALLFSTSEISPVYFILSIFGSSTIDKAQRGRRVFLVLDRIVFYFAFCRKRRFSVKNPNTLCTRIVCFNFLFFFCIPEAWNWAGSAVSVMGTGQFFSCDTVYSFVSK